MGALGGGVADRVDLVGREFQQAGALLGRRRPERLERGLREVGRACDELAGGEPVGGSSAVPSLDRPRGRSWRRRRWPPGEEHRADDTSGSGRGSAVMGSSVSLLCTLALLLFYQRAGPGDAAGAVQDVEDRGKSLADMEAVITWRGPVQR